MPTIVWVVCAFIAGAWWNPDLPQALPDGGVASVRSEPRVAATSRIPSPTDERPDATPDPTAGTAADPLPDCTYADEPATADVGGDWVLALIDTTYRLPAGERPDDLVPVSRAGIAGGGSVREIVLDDLRALGQAAAAAGSPLAVQSAFRSDTRQAEVFAGWVASNGEAAARRFSARPGHSEHQLGTAVDFRAAAGSAPWDVDFETTKAGRWLAAHAVDHGFVMSYPEGAEDEACYGYEPWHFRWVGREMATEVAASGRTLRAWLWARRSGP